MDKLRKNSNDYCEIFFKVIEIKCYGEFFFYNLTKLVSFTLEKILTFEQKYLSLRHTLRPKFLRNFRFPAYFCLPETTVRKYETIKKSLNDCDTSFYNKLREILIYSKFSPSNVMKVMKLINKSLINYSQKKILTKFIKSKKF